jgi:AraC-like DNA-binding protein
MCLIRAYDRPREERQVAVISADAPRLAVYPPGAVLSARAIDDYELVWMVHGTATLVGAEGAAWPLAPGHLLLVPPALRHAFVWDPARTSSHGYVHFRVDAAGPAPTAPLVHRMGAADPAASLCQFLLDVGSRPPTGQHVVPAAVSVLLDVLVHPSAQDARAEAPPAVTRALAHLRAVWAEMPLHPMDVPELAAACGLSPAQLTRVFTGWFGAGPATVLERARLGRAEQLLLRTDLTVAAIARACGFADSSHLTHRFTAAYGTPPGRFRQGIPAAVPIAGSHRLVELVGAIWS